MRSPRLKPATWTSRRLAMLLCWRRWMRRMPPVSRVWAKVRSMSSPRRRIRDRPRWPFFRRRLRVHGVALRLLVVPVLPASLGLGDVAAPARQLQRQHHRFAVIALVGHDLLGTVGAVRFVAGVVLGVDQVLLRGLQR